MKYWILSLFALLVTGFIVVSFPQNTQAATIDGYGYGYVGSQRYTMRNANDARNFLTAYCNSVRNGAMIAAYPSNATLNETNGRMTYTANLVWRSCSSAEDTRAFAITGYPAAQPGHIATCPDAGDYYQNSGTYDCVKYTRSDGGVLTGYSALGCINPTRSGYNCVTGGSSTSGLFRQHVERMQKSPPSTPQYKSYTMYGDVPNWSIVGKTTGSYPFGRPDAFCTFWKWNSNGSSVYNRGCVGLSLNTSWERANYSLTPTITNVGLGVNGEAVPSGAGNRTVSGMVTNNGSTASNPNVAWQLTQLRYAPNASLPTVTAGTSSSTPCNYYRVSTGFTCSDTTTATTGTEAAGYAYPGNKTYTRNSTIGDEPVGTRICYVMSVRPYAHNTTNWRHSALHCYVISKAPKVQVLGGDLIVGRSGTAGRNVVTSVSKQQAGDFGSWTEYALMATGQVKGMASASAYQGGIPSGGFAVICGANLNYLTFNNKAMTAGCFTGGFTLRTTSPATSIDQYFNRMSSSSTTSTSVDVASLAANRVHRLTTSAAAVNVTAGSAMPSGKWVVLYAPTKTVNIRSNLTYTGSALTDAARIPQLVIIANKIVVADTVTTVDAWLVASGTSGIVNTCGVGGTNETANPTASVCGSPLRVNGPVMAKQLLLRRSAGSEGSGSLGAPAETFNLRPDAYLWLTSLQSGAKLTTAASKELPPRY